MALERMHSESAPRLFVYAESPPLDENIPAHGLYRASTPILRAIRSHIARIALYPMDRRYRMDSVDSNLSLLCRSLPLGFTLFRAFRKRLPFLNARFENTVVAAIVGRWARASGASHILTLEGSDPEVLARTDAIAQKAEMPFSVYMVDDFDWTMRLTEKPEAEIAATTARMKRSLSRAHRVFAITNELGALLHKQFSVTATKLNLVFEPGPRPNTMVKDQIIFLGSVNFLYIEPLRTLIDIIGRLRNETGRDLTIRFTSKAAIAELAPLPPYCIVSSVSGADALAAEIAASIFAFLPYSFSEQLRTMVATSFPSKSLEYLAYARSILVYAPEESSSAQIFLRAQLPSVISSPELLEQEIRSQILERPDHGKLYRAHLEQNHSSRLARHTLVEALTL